MAWNELHTAQHEQMTFAGLGKTDPSPDTKYYGRHKIESFFGGRSGSTFWAAEFFFTAGGNAYSVNTLNGDLFPARLGKI